MRYSACFDQGNLPRVNLAAAPPDHDVPRIVSYELLKPPVRFLYHKRSQAQRQSLYEVSGINEGK